MGLFGKKTDTQTAAAEKATPASTIPPTPADGTPRAHSANETNFAVPPAAKTPMLAWVLGGVASLGGFMFGYESGQISGFLLMSDYLKRFAEYQPNRVAGSGHDRNNPDNYAFSPARSGTIVALLCIGTLVGCLVSAPMADRIGRKMTISFWAFFYIIGTIIEISSGSGGTAWVQFAMGRFVAGLGIGSLSTCVPMYQSESIPRAIRGPVVSSYQLLITIGIWTAYMVNYGTSASYDNSAQWRIPNGLNMLWAIILGSTVLLLPESPRWKYRVGRHEEARQIMARLNGCDPNSDLINAEIAEIEEKLQEERAAGTGGITEIFTGPAMLRRTILGMVLQAGQQLTGANFFFYYGTTIFESVGLANPYVTQIILGSVNVGATIISLPLLSYVGRRKALMCGAAWMVMCFLVYSLVGSLAGTGGSCGNVMIVFTCLFIVAFAITWGPIVWSVVSELYPPRYRAICIGLATASNWLFNFLISFFSTFITNKIHYWYGMVFGGCCFALFWIVYFFLIESKDRSLEEIDTMYVLGVNPIKSSSWTPKGLGEDGLVTTGYVRKGEANGPLRGQSVHQEGIDLPETA